MNQPKNSARSGVSGNRKTVSPAGKASATSVSANEPKKQKLILWPEWNENDINAEKWEVAGKVKDSKAKPASAPLTSHGFEDPDPKFEWPTSIQSRIDSFKRPSEIFERVTQVVDSDNGLENFDLMTPNEHLHNSETMRWIISQINTLWDICKKDTKTLSQYTQDMEPITNKALASGRLWRPWEHIYAINKVVKGPFIPVYNPYGKYVVRLYFMGTWRKIIIDDLMPVDEKGNLLLPQTTINGELWPMLLTKALLKVVSLDFNPTDSATEFNDVSVISLLTGWLPEPLPLRFGHITEVWKFLKETLPKYQWPEDKTKSQIDDDPTLAPDSSEMKEEYSGEKDTKSDSKSQKKAKDAKAASGKDTKLDKHKKENKDKKGKSIIDEPIQDENFAPDFPEMVVFASFTDLPLNKLSASTEVADRRERLRKYNLNHDFSNPVWITCTRDVPLNPPPPPEKIPVWKTIRQKKKHVVPSDEPIITIPTKPDQWVELKSPYCGYKASVTTPLINQPNKPNSRLSRLRSRPATAIQGIEEIDEKKIDDIEPESPTNLQVFKLDPSVSDKGDDSSDSKSKSKQKPIDINRSSSIAKKDKSVEGIENKTGPPSVTSMSKVPSSNGDEKLSKFTQENLTNHNNLLVNQSFVVDQTSNADYNKAVTENETKTKLWMDFDDFVVCFKSIIVYHKPSSFKFSEKSFDLRQVTLQQKIEKKKETNASIQMAPLFDEKSPKLLFVDSLSPIELIISFSSLSRWYEQKLELPEKPGKISKKGENTNQEHDTISNAETIKDSGIKDTTPLQAGSLMAEPYSWKSLITGQPLLRIHTTAIRSSFLTLPPGRHVLKFMINSPVGYHIHIVSNIKFNFGDEEEIMQKLTDESCRFIDQALHISKCLYEAIKNFSDPQRQKETLDILFASITPLTDAYLNENKDDKSLSLRCLHETFQNSLYEMLRKSLIDLADIEMAFSWKVFMFDCSSNDLFSLKDKRPETSSTTRGSAKKVEKKKSEMAGAKETGKPDKSERLVSNQASVAASLDKTEKDLNEEKVIEYWKNHIPTAQEHIASVKIQSAWRGYCVRKIHHARTPGTNKNLQVCETLKKSWQSIEQNLHENSLFLFRTMFKINPTIMQYYPFYKDEWNRISYIDFNGSYLEQTANSWFILFRDIFFANEQVLLLPKLYCNLSNCLLKVINNDTYKEIPKVFNKVSPYTYAKNKRGYTIIAESRISDQPVSAGRWRLRLIGSSPSLLSPKPNKTDIISAFDIKETRDYYVPNDNKVIMRYKVVVTDDHLTTLQLSTSKPDVYIKLAIFDNGEEILSVNGKGTAVIPAFIFMKDRLENSPDAPNFSRPGSKTFSSGRASKTVVNSTSETKLSNKNNTKRSSSVNSEVNQNKTNHSRSSSRQSLANELDDDDNPKNHRYIIEAMVLKNSWPLSQTQWAFINNLKENEAAELKVFSKDRASSPSKENKSLNAESKGAALKAAKAKAQKAKTTTGPSSVLSRPASSAFDITKPHWTLKWVSDATSADNIEIKKDTDRIEEIKALKRAWESHESGRSAKALMVRTKFLKENLIKLDGGSITDEELEKPNEDESMNQTVAQNQINSVSSSQNLSVQKQTEKQAQQKQEQPKTTKIDESKIPKNSKQKKEKESIKVSQDVITQPIETLNEVIVAEEILSNRPPTPPKPKIVLPPIDVEPFTRRQTSSYILKDENYEREQAKLRKFDFENFTSFKEQMNKFREEERKYRLQQKIKQIEECELLQAKLDAARKEVFEPREAFRQIFLDAERKRLEEVASQEALLAAQQKTDPKKKGSAGKAKKKK